MTNSILSKTVALVFATSVMAAPISAIASPTSVSTTYSQSEKQHRQNQKNQWRNIAIGSAALGLFGLVKGNNTLTALGAAGAGYSAYRYEQDRKAQSKAKSRAAARYRARHHKPPHHG